MFDITVCKYKYAQTKTKKYIYIDIAMYIHFGNTLGLSKKTKTWVVQKNRLPTAENESVRNGILIRPELLFGRVQCMKIFVKKEMLIYTILQGARPCILRLGARYPRQDGKSYCQHPISSCRPVAGRKCAMIVGVCPMKNKPMQYVIVVYQI